MHKDLGDKFSHDIDKAIIESTFLMKTGDLPLKDIAEIHLSILAIRIIWILSSTGNDLQIGHSFIDSAIELHRRMLERGI